MRLCQNEWVGVLGKTAARLEKFDAALVAGRDSMETQAALNVALAVGVGVAILVALVALARSGHD